MNKKVLTFSLLSLFAIGLISAGLVTNWFSQTSEFEVTNPISVSGEMLFSEAVMGGDSVLGELLTISNDGSLTLNVLVTDNAVEGIETSYYSNLELTKKNVDFNADIWEIPSDAEKVQVRYTAVADEFEAEVTDNSKEGYVLVYYADNDDRFANPGQAVLVEDVLGNLPSDSDENADLNDYSLEYPTTPFGAKIWYVPSSALTLNGEAYDIDWSQANDFYFESKLVQFSDGELTMYPGMDLELTPQFEFSPLLNTSTYSVTIEVNPVVA